MLESGNVVADARARVPVAAADRGRRRHGGPGFGDDRIVVNLTVWASVEDVADFAYRNPDHLAVLRRRREGFRRLSRAHQVL